MAPIVMRLQAMPVDFRATLCVTGQHREMLDQTLSDFGLVPDYDLNVMTEGQSLSELSARLLGAFSRLLDDLRPDIVLVQGDTTSATMAALAAFYLHVPVGHVEAGLRTGDRYSPFPEEINRRLISRLATWHYAPTQTAYDALLKEGTDAAEILLTGNTVVDAFLQVAHEVGDAPPTPDRMILVTAHRRESFGRPFEELCLALRDLIERNPDVRIVYPVHLNPNVRGPAQTMLSGLLRLKLIEPVAYRELVLLLKSCYIVLTDSGGVQEEAPALGKPVLVLRELTERPEGVAAGTAKMVGMNRAAIVRETERLLRDREAYERMARAVSPYGDGRASERIVGHLASLAPAGWAKTSPAPPGSRVHAAMEPGLRRHDAASYHSDRDGRPRGSVTTRSRRPPR